jgi:hypothetical protein
MTKLERESGWRGTKVNVPSAEKRVTRIGKGTSLSVTAGSSAPCAEPR